IENQYSLSIAYDLTSFFVNRSGPPNWTNGDCRDVSGYLNIVTRAIGVGTDIEREFPDPDVGVRTNLICPIGSDGSNASLYYSTSWNFHQICRQSASAYDACAAQIYDTSGNAYMNPPAGWTVAGYWQTPNPYWNTPGNTKPRFFGLVDGYAGQTSGPVARSPINVQIDEVK
ncbi:MAG TPA: hypothetical protein VFG65_01850, partial [Fimbriimonadales bacterium]|nr:hypothetical protein [Fimbriimonadales bacterium]